MEENHRIALKKVALVTGACGFMGSRMVERLKENKGYLVLATDIIQTKPNLKCDQFFLADLTNISKSEELIRSIVKGFGRLEAIFDIKGLFDYAANRDELFKVNVAGTKNLYDAVYKFGFRPRIVVWGAAGGYPFPTTPGPAMTEKTTPNPQGNYLQSKYAQEIQALDFGKKTGLAVTVIRPGGVYGPGARYGVGLTLILAGRGMMGPIAPDTGDNRGSTVHVDDVCGAALFLAEQPAEKVAGQIYNVADDSSYTLDAITRFIGQEVGFTFLPFPISSLKMVKRMNQRLVEKAKKIGRVSLLHPEMSNLLKYDSLLSTAKLQTLGWKPEFPDAKEGLRQTIAWYRQNGWIESKEFQEQRAFLTIAAMIGFSIFMEILILCYAFLPTAFNVWTHLLALAGVGTLIALSWLGYRLVFVISGFNNPDLWTRRKT